MAIVCAVGEEMRQDQAIAGELFSAIAGIPLRLVSQAAARRNITFVIRDADLPDALGRLHERFFALARS